MHQGARGRGCAPRAIGADFPTEPMAWPDGSRFLIAKGVKWGTGPPFYKGPSSDTPWNHDLNWKDYVTSDRAKAAKVGSRLYVQTPAPDGSIHTVVQPESHYLWREASSSEIKQLQQAGAAPDRLGCAVPLRVTQKVFSGTEGRERKLSTAGKNMLVTASEGAFVRPSTRDGPARTPMARPATGMSRPATGASRLSGAGSRALTPTSAARMMHESRKTRKELELLKDTLKRQQKAHSKTEAQMGEILATLREMNPRGSAASRGRKS